MGSTSRWLVAAFFAVGGSGIARAGTFEDVVDGLRFAGFALDQQHIDLTNSDVVIAAHNFQGNTIDVGDFNVALAGPVSLLLERGGRNLDELSFTLSTGLLNINPNRVATVGDPQPLVYSLQLDTGTNDTTIVGNMLFDMRGKINRFGSYDFRFQSSNRQTSSINGRFEDVVPGNADYDIGPIDIEGNIFADLLATITEPFFNATGSQNIFADFSGRTFREQQARTVVDALKRKVEAGEKLTDDDLATPTGLQMMSNVLGDSIPSLSFIEQAFPNGIESVPEPGTLMLLAAGTVAMLARRRSRSH